MDFSRVDRLQNQMLKEMSFVLAEDLKDKPPYMITFTRTEITKDLRYAKVYFSVLGNEEEMDACFRFLKRHLGIIRKFIGNRMRIRHTPEIKFVLDDSSKNILRVNELLNEIKKEENDRDN